MAKPPRSPRPIKRGTNVKDSTVRGRALKPAKGAGMRPELFDEPLPPFVEPCLATVIREDKGAAALSGRPAVPSDCGGAAPAMALQSRASA
jgi:hypothetical protein